MAIVSKLPLPNRVQLQGTIIEWPKEGDVAPVIKVNFGRG